MEQQVPDLPAELRATFERWRQDPINRFVVRLRRHRDDELRRLLADPGHVDVAKFNRDVWALEIETLVGPEGIPLRIFAADNLELHGNYVWRCALVPAIVCDRPGSIGAHCDGPTG